MLNKLAKPVLLALSFLFVFILLAGIHASSAEAEQHEAGKWEMKNGSWYWYYTADEHPSTGWEKINNNWYYFNTLGKMQTGWVKDNGTWYYLNPDGDMATGWKQVNGKWYYLNVYGAMQTGWIKENSYWYYLNPNGDMATGWKLVEGNWYYLHENGKMGTGWIYDQNNWYYLDASGEMQRGWLAYNGHWYYLNNSGDMHKGWKYLDGSWYFLKTEDEILSGAPLGSMFTGGQIAGDKIYYFSVSGKWIKKGNEEIDAYVDQTWDKIKDVTSMNTLKSILGHKYSKDPEHNAIEYHISVQSKNSAVFKELNTMISVGHEGLVNYDLDILILVTYENDTVNTISMIYFDQNSTPLERVNYEF
ncbi:N-acetylmuramoyl-L-alanine amidase family protein [Cytobacillus gottheilii]|uniref:N-acetylmuramoyl-L-alanine amidase family protein n=1 Tax=Cytobacillus gottheilii TaxID=859144 RepID=UPI001594995F|nr:N-acetylmuramoyl-L-alanine amidase family protein [Cytobacillus gottheilii]